MLGPNVMVETVVQVVMLAMLVMQVMLEGGAFFNNLQTSQIPVEITQSHSHTQKRGT